MGKRKSPWSKVANVVLVLLIVILATSFGAKHVLVEGISQAGFAQGISHRMMDTIFGAIGDDMDVLGTAQNDIENSKEVKAMTSKLLDATIKDINGDEMAIENLNLEPEVKSLINVAVSNMKGKVDNRVIETIRQELTSRETEIAQLLKESAISYTNVSSYYPELGKILILYKVYTTNWFRALMGILIVLLLIVLSKIYESKNEAVKVLGLDSIIAGILVILAGFAGAKFLLFASERYLGRGILLTNIFTMEGLVALAIGIVLYVAGRFIFSNKEEV